MKLYVVIESRDYKRRSALHREGADQVVGVYTDPATAERVATHTSLCPHLEREGLWRTVNEVTLDEISKADSDELERQAAMAAAR